MQIIPYSEFLTLENVYLEDSYVTGFTEEKERVTFALLAVLTDGHPAYVLPKSDEQYCYRDALLVFSDVKEVVWVERHFREYMDAEAEVDFGNIDVFYMMEKAYHLEGDWGIVDIVSAPPVFSLQ